MSAAVTSVCPHVGELQCYRISVSNFIPKNSYVHGKYCFIIGSVRMSFIQHQVTDNVNGTLTL